MIHKKIKKFLEEVDLTEYSGGEPINPGLPKEFFSSLDKPSEKSLKSGISARELTYEGLENKRDEINNFLEEAAKEVIKEYYTDFFTQKNISLDIKISSGIDIYNFYEENKIVKEADFDYIKNLKEEDFDEIDEIQTDDNYDDRVIDDEEFGDDDEIEFNESNSTKLSIHKMKLINNIVQGEALNTKALINSQSTKDKLINIYKNYESETLATNRVTKLIKLWNDFANFMKFIDWERGDTKPNSITKETAYGACAVDIGDDSNNSDENPKNNNSDDINWDDINWDDDTNESLIYESSKPKIVIRSRGIDFAMLIHETVKGVYSLAYSNAFKDKDLIKKLAIATGGIADETQDFKYGPIIAEDLRDFINDSIDNNKNDIDIDKYPSIRLYTYKFLCELDSEEFLKVFKGILYQATKIRLEKRHKNKDFDISEESENYILYSKNKVNSIVNSVIQKLINRENRIQEKEKRKKEWDEYQRKLKEWEEYEKNKKTSTTSKVDDQEDDQEDRSNWSKNDYNDAINIALEINDIPRLTLLSNEMRSKKMYENVHTKFKNFKDKK